MISRAGTECHYFVCDVGNREEVYEKAKLVREKVIMKMIIIYFVAHKTIESLFIRKANQKAT